MGTDISKYPAVKQFFAEASQVSKKGNFEPDLAASSINRGEINAYAWTNSYIQCGYYGNPKPNSRLIPREWNVGKVKIIELM